MPVYIVEIRTPSGRKIRKGTIAADEQAAAAGIRHMQSVRGADGRPKCQPGEILDVWLREPGRPLPEGVYRNEKAMQILQFIPLR